MIRAGATKPDGGKIILLGISDENVKRLIDGKPIFVAGSTVGVANVEIVIFHGRTEYEMTESMAKLIGPQTEVRSVRPDELPPDHPRRRGD